jgi:hypothetical protein
MHTAIDIMTGEAKVAGLVDAPDHRNVVPLAEVDLTGDPFVVPTVFAAKDVALLIEIDGEEIDAGIHDRDLKSYLGGR